VAIFKFKAFNAILLLQLLLHFFLHLAGLLVFLTDLFLGLSSLLFQLPPRFSLQFVCLSAGFRISMSSGSSSSTNALDVLSVSIFDVLVFLSDRFLSGETALGSSLGLLGMESLLVFSFFDS